MNLPWLIMEGKLLLKRHAGKSPEILCVSPDVSPSPHIYTYKWMNTWTSTDTCEYVTDLYHKSQLHRTSQQIPT
jgi:hypothetical protein